MNCQGENVAIKERNKYTIFFLYVHIYDKV